MGVLKLSTVLMAVLSVYGCSSGQSSDPPPPAKTVFDPLLQSKERALEVQKTVDHNADAVRKAVDAQERGDSSP